MAYDIAANRKTDFRGEIHVSVRKVEKSFGGPRVLNGLELDVADGEFVALVGESGCGKSTLLRLLAGLDSPDAGEIKIRDASLRGLNRGARVMFQEARVLPWKTVLENVGLGQKDHGPAKALARALLDRVGLADRAGDWPSV